MVCSWTDRQHEKFNRNFFLFFSWTCNFSIICNGIFILIQPCLYYYGGNKEISLLLKININLTFFFVGKKSVLTSDKSVRTYCKKYPFGLKTKYYELDIKMEVLKSRSSRFDNRGFVVGYVSYEDC